jgi:hypothetical protein
MSTVVPQNQDADFILHNSKNKMVSKNAKLCTAQIVLEEPEPLWIGCYAILASLYLRVKPIA